MLYYMVAVRDRASDSFTAPSYVAAVGAAIRNFADQLNSSDKNVLFAAHPEDFDLYELGTFDDAQASFVVLDRPRQIAIGKDLIRA